MEEWRERQEIETVNRTFTGWYLHTVVSRFFFSFPFPFTMLLDSSFHTFTEMPHPFWHFLPSCGANFTATDLFGCARAASCLGNTSPSTPVRPQRQLFEIVRFAAQNPCL